MRAKLSIAGREYEVDLGTPHSIAIPLDFDGAQPNHFGAPRAAAEPLTGGGFVGDTRRGGSCNVPEIRLVPHCNGTHTECVGHIVDEPVPVFESAPAALVPATVVSVTPVPARDAGETCRPASAPEDLVVSRAALESALAEAPGEMLEAVVLRTLPNPEEKNAREYSEAARTPYLTVDAAEYLGGRGVLHLLVDFPSLDRMHDEGRLTVHHLFFGVPEGTHRLAEGSRRDRTVTEMVYVPDGTTDGPYALALGLPAFLLDAAPSRPVLYPLLP